VIGVLTGQKLGAMGVSVFFVLSGYILSYTYLDRDWQGSTRATCRDFFIGRFARIFPLHWLMFLVALPLGLNSNTARVSPRDFPWQLTLTDGLWPGYSPGYQPVKAAWTLSCEALFYLLTPFLFILLSKTRQRTLWTGLMLVSYTAVISFVAIRSPSLNWTAYLRVPEFLTGIFVFLLTRNSSRNPFANFAVASGAILLGFAGLALPGLVPRAFMPFVIAPGAALIIAGCANCTGRVREVLSSPRFVLLGHASYALYLLHDPSMRYMKVFLNRTGIDQFALASASIGILTATGALVGSIVCFKYFETPARKWIRYRLQPKAPAIQRNDDATLLVSQ
jgi:peptidoglycan/LPS O-acetylase OafA/YrhL